MKTKIIVLAAISFSFHAFSCDELLQNHATNSLDSEKITKECEIQDRFRKVRSIFQDYNLNIRNINEYRAIRLIDRYSWEINAIKGNASAQWIYNPMPTTWDIWNNGIKLIFESTHDFKNNILNLDNISYMNKVLLTDGHNNVKDKGTDQYLKPGDLRKSLFDLPVGFCNILNKKTFEKTIDATTAATNSYMKAWEKKAGITLKELVKRYDGFSPSKAD